MENRQEFFKNYSKLKGNVNKNKELTANGIIFMNLHLDIVNNNQEMYSDQE